MFFKGYSDEQGLLNGEDADILLTSGACFLEYLTNGKISLCDLGLVIVDDCHHALDKDHPSAKVMERLSFSYQQEQEPKVIGVTSELLKYQSCPDKVESFLSKLEGIFQCRASVSSDLLAMNRYGEQIMVECNSYSFEPVNDDTSRELAEVLHMTLSFLEDCQPSEESKDCITFVTYLLNECCKVLQMFGPWCCAQTARVIEREFGKFAKRCAGSESELFLQFCRTQASLLLCKVQSLEGYEKQLTNLTEKLFGSLAELKDCKSWDTQHERFKSEGKRSLLPEEALCAQEKSTPFGKYLSDGKSLKPEILNQSLDLPSDSSVETTVSCREQHGSSKTHLPGEDDGHKARVCGDMKEGEPSGNIGKGNPPKTLCQPAKEPIKKNEINKDPFCIVFVRSSLMAQALSSLINTVRETVPEYGFLRSGFVRGKKFSKDNSVQKSLGGQEGIMKSIREGSINVLVATYEAEQEIYVSRCSLVIRLGLPRDYVHYTQVKQTARAAGAKCVFLVPEEKQEESKIQFQVRTHRFCLFIVIVIVVVVIIIYTVGGGGCATFRGAWLISKFLLSKHYTCKQTNKQTNSKSKRKICTTQQAANKSSSRRECNILSSSSSPIDHCILILSLTSCEQRENLLVAIEATFLYVGNLWLTVGTLE